MADQVRIPTEIIVDAAPQSGADNMRIDGSMLESVVNNPDRSFVRIYRWDAPTISLGHFQKSVAFPERFRDCPVVNRLTGGGAILHDRELTYSVAVSAQHWFRHEPVKAYECVHNAIIAVLRELGVVSRMRGESQNAETTHRSEEEFLCFLRQDPRDVVVDNHKIIGSAQRRRKGSILQHGSILMKSSSLVPEILGILDLHSEFPEEEFESRLAGAISSAINEI